MASSQSDLERQRLRDEMNSDAVLSRILRQLETGKGDEEGSGGGGERMDEATTTSRVSRRKEVLEDSGIVDGTPGTVPGSRQLLDLEDLAFSQGSHFMSNKRCQLPDGSFRKQRKGIYNSQI